VNLVYKAFHRISCWEIVKRVFVVVVMDWSWISRFEVVSKRLYQFIDPEKIESEKIEKFDVKLYNLNRFFAIFCEFCLKIHLDTGKRLEMTWNMCHNRMTHQHFFCEMVTEDR